MLPEGAPAAVLTLKLTGLLHGSQEGNFRGEEGQQPWPEPQGHVASRPLKAFTTWTVDKMPQPQPPSLITTSVLAALCWICVSLGKMSGLFGVV